MRIAPEGGYDFGTKRQYRRDVWRKLSDYCPVPRAEAHALLMPSLEGDEIDVALSKGFREYNLHIVDRNPAIVATLKRRYPRINTYGVEVEHAFARIAKSAVRLSVANLDLTSCLADRTIKTIGECADSGALADYAVVAVTLLRGRERGDIVRRTLRQVKDWDTRLNDYVLRMPENWFTGRVRRKKEEHVGCDPEQAPTDEGRTIAIAFALMGGIHSIADMSDLDVDEDFPRFVWLLSQGTYKSTAGSQTMMWSVYRLGPSDTEYALDCLESAPADTRHVLGGFMKRCLQWKRTDHVGMLAQEHQPLVDAAYWGLHYVMPKNPYSVLVLEYGPGPGPGQGPGLHHDWWYYACGDSRTEVLSAIVREIIAKHHSGGNGAP